MHRIKKIKLFLLGSIALKFLYDDLEKSVGDLWRGKPEIDGVILLGADTNIKPKLISYLSKQVYTPLSSFFIYGEEQRKTLCSSINIPTNNIYIYSNYNDELPINRICYNVGPNIKFDIDILFSNIKIPLHMYWIGFNRLHFELLGQYTSSTFNNVIKKSLNLPLKSTFIFSGNLNKLTLYSATEELIFNTFNAKYYTTNPYLKYCINILLHPGDYMFIIKTPLGTFVHNTYLNQLTEFDNDGIVEWQKKQIKSFYKFFQSYIYDSKGKKELEFESFFMHDLHKQYNINIDRYKELLFLHYTAVNELNNVKSILANEVDINSKFLNGVTALYISTHLGYLPMIQLLIKSGAEIDITRDNNATSLMIGALNNSIKSVEYLLISGANINAFDINLNTALVLATLKNNVSIIELLIQYNAGLDIVNNKGETALIIASTLGYTNIVKKLLDNNANPNIRNNNGEDALLVAIKSSKIGLIELLVISKCSIDQQHILMAIEQNDFDIVEKLLPDDPMSIYSIPYSFKVRNKIINFFLKNIHDKEEMLYILQKLQIYNDKFNIKEVNIIKNCVMQLDSTKCYNFNSVPELYSEQEKFFFDDMLV